MKTVQDIFDGYQPIRHRQPAATFPKRTEPIGPLMNIADHIDAFVFDAFGVSNAGEIRAPCAAERLDALRARLHNS